MRITHNLAVDAVRTRRIVPDIEEIPLGTAKSRVRAGMSKLHSLSRPPDDDYDQVDSA
jgi:hypothetical protein